MNAHDIVARFIAENPIVTHELVQGSPEWHAFRGKYEGASEAAAALGLSKKVTRNELLRAKSTGIAREFSDFVQTRILDRGHEVEAAARPHVEGKLGRGLFPVTCSRGNLSASCDGRTAADDVTWEHKQWNEDLAASVAAWILPEEHWPQCQQNLLVTGAEKLIFTVSDGTPDRMVSMEVYPDHEKFAQIIAGWAQFEKDLAEYQHVEDAPAPVGRAPDQLPALRIELVGQVTDSNLHNFHGHALAVLGNIKTDLQTDEDFANAEKTVKWCSGVEEQLAAAKQHALSQTESIDNLFRTIDSISEETRQVRLKLDRLVKVRKEAIRGELVQAARENFSEHVAALQAEIKGVQILGLVDIPDFGSAIKGLKTVSSLRNAVDTALSQGKMKADEVAKDIRTKLAWCRENAEGYGALFHDIQQLVRHEMVAFQAIITNRVEEHKRAEAARLEAERERIRAEEEDKARERVEAQAKTKQSSGEFPENETAPSHSEPRLDDFAMPAIQRPGLTPSRKELIDVVAGYFNVQPIQAESWLNYAFGRIPTTTETTMNNTTQPKEIPLHQVESSQIAAIGHDPETNTLAIQFKAKSGEGSVYHYANFDADAFAALKGAESIGSHFGQHIKPFKDKYPFTKMRDAVPATV